MSEVDRLERLEKAVGILVGAALGGLPGARLGASAISLHQMSPIHELEVIGIEHLEGRIRQARAERSPAIQPPSAEQRWEMAAMPPTRKKKRRASAYSKRYGKCFKKLQSKYKKKNGQWKKDGFKRCAKAARRCAKK